MVGVRTFIGTSYNTEIGKNLIANSQNVFEFTATQTGELALSAKVSEDVENIFTEIMLTKGTTPKPYLPYGYIGLEQSGINKLKLRKNKSSTLLGVTCSIDNDGVITLNGTVESGNPNFLLSGDGEILTYNGLANDFTKEWFETLDLPAKNYSIKYEVLSGSGATTYRPSVVILTENYKNDQGPFGTQTMVNNYSNKICGISVYVSGGMILDNFKFKLSIVEGNYNINNYPSYEPYHEPKIIPINLNGNTLAKVGDIKDLLKIYRNGNIEIEKLSNDFIIDKDSNILVENDSSNNMFVFVLENINNSKGASSITLSNYIKHWNNTWDNNGQFISWNNHFYLRFKNNEFGFNANMTNDEALTHFKEMLAKVPLHCYYTILEPQTIKLPSINPIEPWEGTNIFKLITNLDTTMQVDYYKNYEKYVISNIDF